MAGQTHAVAMMHSITIIANTMSVIGIMLGLGLFMGGLFQLKRYGEMRTFMSHQMTIWAPGAMIFAGVLLLMLPWTVSTALLAFWGDGQTLPLAYTGSGQHDIDVYIPVILAFIRVIGVGAIMRACMMLSKTGGQGQPGQLGKALTHLFGGILCVHILGTVTVIKYIFGIAS
jgi:intracellular multiplication protein IcmC